MQKVIDTNYLHSEELGAYLADPRNSVLLTDDLMVEIFKGVGQPMVSRSLARLAPFAGQVVVLKGKLAACRQPGRPAGLRRRLIDPVRTSQFVGFARAISTRNDALLARDLALRQAWANADIARLDRGAAHLKAAIAGLEKACSREELRQMRIGRGFAPAVIPRLADLVLDLAGQLASDHPAIRRWPRFEELKNLLIFRAALCIQLLALDRLKDGTVQPVSLQDIRNDSLDMYQVAFATFFDGILTADQRPRRIHSRAVTLLRSELWER